MTEELESAVAKVVNHRSDYEQSLLKRIEELIAQHDHMEAGVLRLREALEECEEYFDNRADADCDHDGFIPNEEMKLLTTVRAALNGGKS